MGRISFSMPGCRLAAAQPSLATRRLMAAALEGGTEERRARSPCAASTPISRAPSASTLASLCCARQPRARGIVAQRRAHMAVAVGGDADADAGAADQHAAGDAAVSPAPPPPHRRNPDSPRSSVPWVPRSSSRRSPSPRARLDQRLSARPRRGRTQWRQRPQTWVTNGPGQVLGYRGESIDTI